MKLRRFRLIAVVFAAIFSASGIALADSPDTAKIHAKLEGYGVGSKVKLLLADHFRVEGTVAGFDQQSVQIMSKGATRPKRVPLTAVVAVRDRSSLGSRFRMGPCVGPVTLVLAAPFITAAYLLGH